MNNKIFLLVLGFIIFLGLWLRFCTSFAITYSEAEEGYNAYSLLKTARDVNSNFLPLIFKGEGDYPSTLATYFRMPGIFIFGLNEFGLRVTSILIGLSSIVLFLIFLFKNFENFGVSYNQKKPVIILGLTLFASSPFLIQASIFNLSLTLSLFFILLGLLLISFTSKIYKIFGVFSYCLSIFASFYSIPIVLTLLFVYTPKTVFSKKNILTLVSCSVVLIIIFINSNFLKFVFQKTSIFQLSPQNFSWKIERSLSFDQVEGSVFQTTTFNFNRFIHNKYVYSVNSLLNTIIQPFNLERLSSPLQFQSDLILEKEILSEKGLPKFFYFQTPIIFLGLIYLLKLKSRYLVLLFGGLFTVLIFPNYLNIFFLLPFLIISEISGLLFLAKSFNKKIFKLILFIYIIFLTFGQLNFQDLLRNHQDFWMNEEDFRQSQIWSSIKENYLSYQQIMVTDRVGEPINYFLFYTNFSPKIYQEERILGGTNSQNLQKIASIMNVNFRSFQHHQEDRQPSQLWVGLAGDFLGPLKNYKDVEKVKDGVILKKFYGVKSVDKFYGDELWIVETQLDPVEKINAQ